MTPVRRTAGGMLLALGLCACQSGSVATRSTPAVTTSPSQPAPVGPTQSPEPPPAPVVRVVRLDADQLLVTTSLAGTARRFEVLDRSGHRRSLARPADLGIGPTQAFVDAGTWVVVTFDCATIAVGRSHSSDGGRSWTGGVIGDLGCHAGDVATVFDLGRREVLVASTGVGEFTAITVSADGVHWPVRHARRIGGASTLAFQPDGSYVRVEGFADFPDQRLLRASGLGAREREVRLPDGAQPLGYTLAAAGGRYALMSSRARPFISYDGQHWSARTAPFPGCACTRINLSVLTRSTWWAAARVGRADRYAVTRDGGSTWVRVAGPAGRGSTYPEELVGWDATSAVVERDGLAWLTADTGRSWRRL